MHEQAIIDRQRGGIEKYKEPAPQCNKNPGAAMLMYGMMDLYSLDVKSDSMEDSTKIHTEYCIRCNNYVSHSLCRFDAHWDAVHEVRLLGEKMGWLNLCSAV